MNIDKQTRASNNRKAEAREYTYKPASDISVPDEVVNHFTNEGYHLRWIRAFINGQDDSQNLMSRSREGYTWVKASDLPAGYENTFQVTKLRGSSASIICVGDLILGKIEKYKAEARQQYFEQASTDQVKRAKTTALKGDAGTKSYDPRMDRMVPLEDDSTTEVEVGKPK